MLIVIKPLIMEILLASDPLIIIQLSQKQRKQDMISVDPIPDWTKQI